MTFTQYFNENKETLKDGHAEHVLESKQMDQQPMSLKTWAKKIYDALKEQGDI